jgi:hypothetical protein
MTPGAKFSMVDADSKTTYAVVYPSSTPVTWMTAFDTCKSLGFDWTLPTLTNPQQSLAARAHLRTDMALGLVREVHGTGRFVWHDGAAMTFGNWRSTEPASDLCAAISATDGQWYTVDCATTVHFASVMCQSTKASRLTSFVNWISPTSRFAHDFDLRAFNTSDLPSGSFTSRGVTVQIRASQCVDGDRFVLTTNNDRLTVLRDDHCLLWIGGDASSAEYAAVLTGIRVVGALGLRTAINVGAVYWTNPLVRNMVIDTLTANVYGTYTTNWYWTTPVALNNAYDVNTLCTSNAMNVTSISTAEEDREVLRAARYLPAVIGGQRSGVTTTFAWSNGVDTWTYSAWKPLLPSTTSSQTCVEATVSGWVDVDCATSRQSQIVCEAPAASWAQKASVTLAITPFVHTYTTVRTLPATISALTIITPTTDLDWIAVDVVKVFGATVQVATHQCDATADVFSAQNLTLPVTIRRRTSACALFFDAPYGISIAQIKSLLATVRFSTTNTVRSQLSFAVSAWMTPGAKFSMVDADSKTTYAVVYPSSTPVTWMTAFDTCKSLGFDWTLPTLTNPQQSLAARAHLRTDMALGLVREVHGTGRFVWHDGAAMTFGNWRSTEPASDLCAAISATDGQWYTVDCATTVHFASVMCQSTKASRLLTTINWIVSDFVHDETAVVIQPGVIPSSSEMIYGASVNIARSSCFKSDNFVLKTNNDKITVISTANCVLHVAGQATAAEYVGLLEGIEFQGFALRRVNVSFGFSMWRNPRARLLLTDIDTGNVISTQTMNWYYQTPSPTWDAYTYDAPSACTVAGMYPADVNTTLRVGLVAISQGKTATAWIGLLRDSGLTFKWASGLPTSYTSWQSFRPQLTSDNCVYQNAAGQWNDDGCDNRHPQMACEGTWIIAHTGTTMITFNGSVANIEFYNPYQEPVIVPTNSTTRDGADLPSSLLVYGGTAMLALHQCTTGDKLTVDVSDLPSAVNMNITSIHNDCVLFISSPGGVLGSDIKAAFDRVRFTQTRKDRAQITFSFIIWTEPNIPNLLTDPETNNAYTLFDFTTAKDWVHTGLACRGLGPDWSLITVNSRTEAAIAATHVATLGRLPLSMDRSSGAWKWVNSDPITYMGWGAGQPAGTTNACAEVSATGEWVNADCSLAQYQWAVCESMIAPFGYSVAHVRPAVTKAYVNMTTIFTSAVLPAGSLSILYGATAHTVSNVTECYTDDAFHLSATVKYITLVREGPCMLMFGGVTTTQNYNRLFLGLQFTGRYPYRRQIAFAAVYWTTAQMRELMVEAVSGKVYNTYTMNWRWDPTTHGDVWYPLSGHCALMGMDPASITNRLASTEQLRTRLGSTNMLIGAVRATATSFKWTFPSSGLSDATVAFQEWFATEPNAANDCTVHTASHSLWTTVDCATQVPTIACSRESHGAVFNTGPLPLLPPSQQAARWLAPTSPYSSVNLTLDLTHVRDDLVVHGATLHIAEPQCDGSDVLFLPTATSKWPAVTMEYRAASCALFMSSPMTAIDYKQMLSEVVLNTTAIRPMTSFVWIFWMDATLRDMLMDVETRVVYSYLAVASNVTWQQAYADCRLAGSTWRMASPLFAHEQDTARGFIDSILTEGPLPIAASNIYTSPSYQWLTEERMSFVDWAENEPFTSMAGKACVELTHDLGLTTTVPHWTPADCVDPRYHRVFCESRTYEFAGVHNFIADMTAYPPVAVSNPIPEGVLPAVGLDEIVFGATVEISAEDCDWSDRFMPNVANDLIVVVHDAGCFVEFAGMATIAEYNMVLSNVGWRAMSNTRPLISYSYVYWPSPYARGLRVAIDTRAAFTAIPSTTYEVAPSTYPYITADDFCGRAGMERAEIATIGETAAVNRTIRYGQPLLAKLVHDATNCSFAKWAATARATNYSRWDTAIDLCDNSGVGGETDICAVTNAEANWTRVQCGGATPTRVPAVACRAGVKGATARKSYAVVYIHYNSDGQLNITDKGFMNLANSTMLEKVYVHLAITQCKPGDTFMYRFSTPPANVTLTIDEPRCRVAITGRATVKYYRQLVTDLVFMAQDKGRVHLVFSVIAVQSALLKDAWVEPQTSFTYASVALSSAKSWNDVQVHLLQPRHRLVAGRPAIRAREPHDARRRRSHLPAPRCCGHGDLRGRCQRSARDVQQLRGPSVLRRAGLRPRGVGWRASLGNHQLLHPLLHDRAVHEPRVYDDGALRSNPRHLRRWACRERHATNRH